VQQSEGFLESSGWDKNSSPPPLPPEVIERTAARYREAHERLTGEPL
jgi:phosphoribosylaminoimidazole-succinocarboxamide synthase